MTNDKGRAAEQKKGDSPVETLGADWVNLSIIEDYSTKDVTFEIHLKVPLTAAEVTKVKTALNAAKGPPHDYDGKALKKELKIIAKTGDVAPPGESKSSPNRSKRQIIDAITIKP